LKITRCILLILFINSGLCIFSQIYADKNYYLIDSLNLEELSDGDRRLLDSVLILYHNTENDTIQLNALAILQQNLINNNWIKYNQLVKIRAEKELNEEQDELVMYFYSKLLGDAINNLGFISIKNGDTYNGLKHYKQSLNLRKKIRDKKGISNSFTNIGAVYRKQGSILKSLECYYKALKIQEEIGDEYGKTSTLNNLAYIYADQGYFEKALKTYKECLNLKLQIDKNEGGVSTILNNIGLLYYKQKKFEKALGYYQRSLKIRDRNKDKKGIANSLTNIGLVYYSRNEFSEALKTYQRALIIDKEVKYKEGVAFLMVKIGFTMLELNKTNMALSYATESFKLSNELGYPDNIQESAKLLSDLYRGKGDYENGWKMYELYVTMKDSTINAINQNEIIQIEARHELEKTEQDVKLKEKNIEVLEKDKKFTNYVLYSSIVFFLLLFSFIFVWFRNYKQKREIEKKEMEYQLNNSLKEIDVLRANINAQIADVTPKIIFEISSKNINSFLSSKLTEREIEIVVELTKAKTNKEIAETLFISVSTVKSHLLNIYEKLDVKNRIQAINKMIGLRTE
jgi:tetratricopeptide (TPR) repeat protein/DNA-binding CsgD family transcriptional regulator